MFDLSGISIQGGPVMAPLRRLLGTVTGMIGSFGIITQAGIGQPHKDGQP